MTGAAPLASSPVLASKPLKYGPGTHFVDVSGAARESVRRAGGSAISGVASRIAEVPVMRMKTINQTLKVVALVGSLSGAVACNRVAAVDEVPVGAEVQLTRKDGALVEGNLPKSRRR